MFIRSLIAAILMSGLCRVTLAAEPGDHLVPVGQHLNDDAPKSAYTKLWQEKLLVAHEAFVCFVHLPGNVGEEAAVSIHQDTTKRNGKSGGYWLTVTQPSISLRKCVSEPGKQRIDVRQVRIRRCDIPLRESTTITIKKLWLVMLAQARADPPAKVIELDTSAEIFWAKNASGLVRRAKTPGRFTKNTSALFYIANLLTGYCDTPASQDKAYAHEIEKRANALLKRVTEK